MKIKIIDLLNKIANGNDMPLSFRYENIVWVLKGGKYYQEEDDEIELEKWFESMLFKCLNEEIEIIEEEKEIEKIKSNGIEFYSDYINVWIKKEETAAYCEYLMNKVNELIDAVNELKRGN